MLSFHFMAILHFLLIFSLLNLAFAGKHGTLPEEDHWISVFPNTPMPKALKDLLAPPAGDSSKESKDKDAPINPFIIYENTNTKRQPKEALRKELKNKDGTNKKSKGVNAPINPFIIYGKESKGLSKELKTKDHINKKSKGVNAPISPFIIYGEKSKGNKKHGSAAINGTMYFFQEDLHPGKWVNLPLLAKTRDLATFLPQQVARSIPFSSNEFPQILNLFSLDPESMEANDMEQTINVCEREGMRGEEIFCATSFESFVDSSVSKLGKNIQLLANELAKETNNPVFTIGRGIQNMGEEELVCHKMSYPYAVFLCHSIDSTMVYKVPLVGMDGTKAKALVICHKDTSAWSPSHPVFEILKVKPGTVPICHFAVRDTLAWVRK
ncbi:BURP domain protein RD22-like isoform X1 [Gossypium arboreum]|nr:BURP domain protein RD22-like isoform X1 [Gossypium arboreum]